MCIFIGPWRRLDLRFNPRISQISLCPHVVFKVSSVGFGPMAVNHWPSSLHLGSSEVCEVVEFGQFLSRFWLSLTILYHPPKHSTFCTENVKGNRSIWILDLGECAAITRNLAYRSAQICQCCMVHRCRIAAYSPFNPITLFCQMLNRCKMFKTCFCLCIPYTASGHHCFGHPRAWTPSWFIARTLMARYWTQILNRFPSFPFCFAKLDRQLLDALHHCQSTLERRLGILDSSMIMLQDRFALLRPGFVQFPRRNFVKPMTARFTCTFSLWMTKETSSLQWQQSKGVTRDSTEPS